MARRKLKARGNRSPGGKQKRTTDIKNSSGVQKLKVSGHLAQKESSVKEQEYLENRGTGKVKHKNRAAQSFSDEKQSEGRLKENIKLELSESRGDTRKETTGGTRRPQQKRRLQFASEETGEEQAVKAGKAARLKTGENEVKKVVDTGKEKQRKAPDEHSNKQKKFNREEARKGNKRLRFETKADEGGKHPVRKAGTSGLAVASTEMALKRKLESETDENSAVGGVLGAEEALKGAGRMKRRISSKRKPAKSARSTKLNGQSVYAASYQSSLTSGKLSAAEEKKKKSAIRKWLQKKQIQKDYAKAKRATDGTTTATVGTIEYIKKVGGKITDFFKENRKVYISIMLLLGLMLLLMASLTSCSSMFLQNVIDYSGTSYMSTDEAIRKAELYYTQMEADLQEQINDMQTTQSDYDEYRYNIASIEHDPFILISYLSAKYEIFTFDDVKDELEELFALQYGVEQQVTNETITETRMVRVGESLGQVVTSGYCSCVICCGIWSGGPTASGAMPTGSHTIAVDASNPYVPMGTKVIMNGTEYVVEDTGNFARYGVQFDVYYDSHSAAAAHGHQTWEAYLADDNGSQEVEVKSTRQVEVLNTTVTNKGLSAICSDRLSILKKDLLSTYNETKGNLQMFESPFTFNWYSRISSYYGYRIHPISSENQIHNGLDIAAPGGMSVSAGLTGTVVESGCNDSYGNYVIIKNSLGYELRYAHLESRSVSEGDAVLKGDEIGKVGSTGNSTGNHLHLELLKNGERMNPLFYMETGTENLAGSSEYCSDAARALIEEAERHLGTPYVWGGFSPGGFDCSGFVSYALIHSGARNTGRLTAQGLYNICTPVSESEVQPGDLIFFTGTYNAGEPVTHVGIYAGNGQMIHCGHPVQYASIYSSYWQSHFYAFGRW